MHPSPAAAAAIDAFARRLALGAFVSGCLGGLSVAATGFVLFQLLARSFTEGVEPWWGPRPLWFAVLAPVIVWAGWQVVRQRLPAAAIAEHLDRRLGLHGLLLCAHAGVPLEPVWQQKLTAALTNLPRVLPAVRLRDRWSGPSLALGFALFVGAMGMPAAPPAAAPGASASALQRLTEEVSSLAETLPAEVARELQRQLADLSERVRQGDPQGEADVWRALDQLGQRVARERALSAMASAQRDASAGEGVPVAALEPMLRMAKLLASTGAVEHLPALLRRASEHLPALLRGLQRANERGDGAFDPAQLAASAEGLAELARALIGDDLEAKAQELLAGLSPDQRQELRALARDLVGESGQSGALGGHGPSGQGPRADQGGRGAVGGEPGQGPGGAQRGPGPAALWLTEATPGRAEHSLVLPPGTASPDEWVPVASHEEAPKVQPVPNTGPGGEAATGTGGASWQLRLAPRHRPVVRQFFDAGTGEGKR